MKRRRLTDDALGDALVVRGASGTPATPCPPEERIWEAFQGKLDPAEVTSLLDHAASCADCSLAMRVAQAMGEASPAADRAPGLAARLWQGLAGTILRPAPALAYLLLLALSFPLFREMRERSEPRPATPVEAPVPPPSTAPAAPAPRALTTPRTVRLSGDLELRGESAAQPTRLRAAPGEVLLLRVFPDFSDAPAGGKGPLVVRLLEGERVVSETMRDARAVEPDGSIALVLESALLRAGITYRLEVAGPDPAGGVFFRQTFALEEGRPGE